MSQMVDNRNPAAGKRARTDGGRREDDWTCPSCGNVNFSFRTTCNMRNCTHPRPDDHNTKLAPKPLHPGSPYSSGGYIGSTPPPSVYLRGQPYSSSLFSGSTMPRYDLPYSGFSAYPYSYGSRFGSPYGPLHMSGPPYFNGSMLGTGGMYNMPPVVDRYGVGFPMGHGPMAARPNFFPNESSHPQKKSAVGGRSNDWTCPNCGNTNFSFRTVCNMRKCNTPRPVSEVSKSESTQGSKPKMPEGSWKCENCNNINYPFRTKCNRQSCGVERPAESQQALRQASNEDNQ